MTPDEAAEFRRRFDVMALQRNLKALGTFGYQTVDARQSGLHPVHPAHAQLRARQPREDTRASAGCAISWPGFIDEVAVKHGRLGTSDRGCCSVSSLRFGVSTHLYHDQRLDRDHLVEIAAHGFDCIELFATRTHFDYHDAAAVRSLAEWLDDTRLDAQLGARADLREPDQRRVGRGVLERDRRRTRDAGRR